MKWMMGWMHDTLRYFKQDPLYRKFQQDQFCFSMMYYYDENFMLPLSHDEVVHGKSPMLYKMPGDEWQKFANLRLLYTYMYTHPGAKLLFMGNEFGQTSEWNYKSDLDWHLLQYDGHRKMQDCIRVLNRLYRDLPALHIRQFEADGFEWVDLNHREDSVIVYKRRSSKPSEDLLVILNMTPVVRNDWRVNVRGKRKWKEIFNSDDQAYYGTGDVYNPIVRTEVVKGDRSAIDLIVNLPPLGAIILG